MCKKAEPEFEESEMEKEGREQTKPTLPARCRWCREYSCCDLVFCLKWWH